MGPGQLEDTGHAPLGVQVAAGQGQPLARHLVDSPSPVLDPSARAWCGAPVMALDAAPPLIQWGRVSHGERYCPVCAGQARAHRIHLGSSPSATHEPIRWSAPWTLLAHGFDFLR